jgi:hypothetical protein
VCAPLRGFAAAAAEHQTNALARQDRGSGCLATSSREAHSSLQDVSLTHRSSPSGWLAAGHRRRCHQPRSPDCELLLLILLLGPCSRQLPVPAAAATSTPAACSTKQAQWSGVAQRGDVRASTLLCHSAVPCLPKHAQPTDNNPPCCSRLRCSSDVYAKKSSSICPSVALMAGATAGSLYLRSAHTHTHTQGDTVCGRQWQVAERTQSDGTRMRRCISGHHPPRPAAPVPSVTAHLLRPALLLLLLLLERGS